ncbi:hypothetical protein [Roseofilum casamattae]|uniref:Uncharacterized protein n=1 Tax=Roseofilum casamattae BLCC-M143 TaxID=3022442 RepID=A0ABT7C0L5_9CYAN|nr:hypothetical protein [Roseofilum casamattae]MDJ1184966.1 hypothetical protein [Roseofilum casamattae BLCC-M143]
MGRGKMYGTRRKARRAKLSGKSKISLQASQEEQNQPLVRERSALEQSGSLLEKVWGSSIDPTANASSERQATAIQAKSADARSSIDYSYVHIQRQPSAESYQYPPTWMNQSLPALSAPLRGAQNTSVQRLRLNTEDNHYYSDASPIFTKTYKADTVKDAFITVTSFKTSGIMGGGGHTTIFLEYFSQGRPVGYQIELDATGENVGFSVSPQNQGEILQTIGSKGAGLKKTWKISKKNAKKALKYARQTSNNSDFYKYNRNLTTWTAKQNEINCALFGERVLKAAGIQISASGLGGFKRPDVLTEQKWKTKNVETKDGSIPQVYSTDDINQQQIVQNQTNSKLPKTCYTQEAFVELIDLSSEDTGLSAAGKHLERYHMYSHPFVRIGHLTDAAAYIKSKLNMYTYMSTPRDTEDIVEEIVDRSNNENEAKTNLTEYLQQYKTELQASQAGLNKLVEGLKAVIDPMIQEMEVLKDALGAHYDAEMEASKATDGLAEPSQDEYSDKWQILLNWQTKLENTYKDAKALDGNNAMKTLDEQEIQEELSNEMLIKTTLQDINNNLDNLDSDRDD